MRILVTGSDGFVGGILRDRLRASITPFDLPEHDARDYDQLVEAARGHDAIVHLAWDTTENSSSDAIVPDNARMSDHVYRAAVAAGVPRVVVASSVHADAFRDVDPAHPLDPLGLPTPDSPYGASKVFLESLGRHHATAHGLVVCCLRFGGIAPEPNRHEPEWDQATWLGFGDCARLVQASLDADLAPGHHEIVNGVSRHPASRHSTRNSLGWTPVQSPPSSVRRAVRRTRDTARRRLGRHA